MKGKIALKWAVSIIAILVLMAVGAVVWFFVAFYLSMEKGEEHRRQLQALQDSGKWDFGDQPALFAVAQGIVKNDRDAVRAVRRPRFCTRCWRPVEIQTLATSLAGP